MPERPKKKTTKKAKVALLERLLRWNTRAVSARPKITLWMVLVLTCVAAGYTVTFLRFNTARADLIDPNAPFHQRWLEYTESFGDSTDMMVVVEGDDTGTIRRTLDGVAARLDREPELFGSVLYRLDTSNMRRKALQYLTPNQLRQVRDKIRLYKPIWEQNRWSRVRLESYVPKLTSRLQAAETDQKVHSYIRQANQLTSSMHWWLDSQSEFLSPWSDPLQLDPNWRRQSGNFSYFLNDTGTMGFLKVKPVLADAKANPAADSISRLREIVAEVQAEFPVGSSAQLGVTGIPVLEHDEMMRSQIDMLKATALAFVLVGVMLLVGFRGIRHPMLALMILVVGMAWTFGLLTLGIGHLNILSVSFAVILIGLGIDFGIHYLSRYLQLRHEKKLLRPALEETTASVGPGIVTSALTTSLAFGAAYFTDFLGVAELGMIAGGGVLLCALATFFVMPALLALADKHAPADRLPVPMQGRVLRSVLSGSPLMVLIVALLICGGVTWQAFTYENGEPGFRVRYDQNMLKLQAQGIESVDVQNRIFRDSHNSLLYAVSMAGSWDDARALEQQFEALPSVDRVEGLASRLPAQLGSESTQLIQQLEGQLAGLPRSVPRFAESDPATIGQQLELMHATLTELVGVDPAASPAARNVDHMLDRLDQLSSRHQAAFLTSYQSQMAKSLLRQFHEMSKATDLTPVNAADLPDEWKERYVSENHQWLMQIYPKEQVWDEEPLARFVADLRTVDPFVTGTPIQNYESSTRIFNSYKTIVLYALAIISLVLLLDLLSPGQKLLTLLPPIAIVGFIGYTLYQRNNQINVGLLVCMYLCMVAFIGAVLDFRNLRDMFLAMLPPVLGLAMMLGVLGMLQVNLNPANLIVLPLILGIGVDDGIHVIHDFRRQRGDEYGPSPSTINAIVMTSVTSIIGFGSLMIASHQGLYSLGLVLAVGVACCLFVSLVVLPAILTMVGIRQSSIEANYVGESDEDIARELERLEAEEKQAAQQQAKRKRKAA